MRKIIFGCFLSLAATVGQAFAGDTPLQRLHSFLSKAASLRADFRQVLVDDKGAPIKESKGEFFLQRPGKFRWDYLHPYKQEIVSNGGKVWFYDTDLEQVTVKKLNQAIGSTPALLLMGETPLEKNFDVESQDREEGLYWIKLLPKQEDSGFKSVLIGLAGDNLAGMELSDNFGQTTRIYFTNLKLGVKQDADRFEFKPPAGVDVFEEK